MQHGNVNKPDGKRMKEAAQKQGYDCDINAYALQKAEEIIPAADVLLVGPQIAFEVERLRKEYRIKRSKQSK